tara:strand:+ start:302 stop:742 length:441 start_codon:yes stop_codon:yes gene_type:complete
MDTFDKLNEDNQYVKKILEHSKHWLHGKKLTTFNIMELVTKLIPYTQTVMNEKGLGPMKKKVIMSVLLLLVEKLNFSSENEKQQIKTVIEETVPSSIDLMIDISKGNIDFQKIIKQGSLYSKFFGSCCGKTNEKKDKKSSQKTTPV